MTEDINNKIDLFSTNKFQIEDISTDLIHNLLDKYPFSPFGHLLKFLKADAGNDEDAQFMLNKLAAYSPDRAQLQALLQRLTSGFQLSSAAVDEIPSEGRNFDVDRNLFEFDFQNKPRNIAPLEKDASQEVIPSAEQKVDQPPISEQSNDQNEEELSPYVQWLITLSSKKTKHIDNEDKLEKDQENITKVVSTKISPTIETKQTDFFGEVITETLAEVLANQGQNERAIAMYQKLSLIFPEKSSFFAARIDKLKNT